MKNVFTKKILFSLFTVIALFGAVSVVMAHTVYYDGKGGCTVTTYDSLGRPSTTTSGTEVALMGTSGHGCLINTTVYTGKISIVPGPHGGDSGDTTKLVVAMNYFASVYPDAMPASTR